MLAVDAASAALSLAAVVLLAVFFATRDNGLLLGASVLMFFCVVASLTSLIRREGMRG